MPADNPFTGIRVLDMASFVAAPAAATILADFGADVVKVEPLNGDPQRRFSAYPGMPVSDDNYGWTLESRSKRSLALDLKNPAIKPILHRLVASADVLVTNFALPTRARLGIDYDTLTPLNPRLVYASFTAFGEAGEEADWTGYDATAWWARSGLMDQLRPEAASSPARSVPAMGDHPSAVALFAAIVTALWQRERTGKGSYVSSSLLANGLWSNAFFVQAALGGAAFPPRPARTESPNALSNHYECRDGRWLIVAVTPLHEERAWSAFCTCMERPDLADDLRFSSMKARRLNVRALIGELDVAFARRDAADWSSRLGAAGLGAGVASRITDVPADAQAIAAGMLVPIVGTAKPLATVSSPLVVRGIEKRAPQVAPALGEHTHQILGEIGLNAAEIAELQAVKAIS